MNFPWECKRNIDALDCTLITHSFFIFRPTIPPGTLSDASLTCRCLTTVSIAVFSSTLPNKFKKISILTNRRRCLLNTYWISGPCKICSDYVTTNKICRTLNVTLGTFHKLRFNSTYVADSKVCFEKALYSLDYWNRSRRINIIQLHFGNILQRIAVSLIRNGFSSETQCRDVYMRCILIVSPTSIIYDATLYNVCARAHGNNTNHKDSKLQNGCTRTGVRVRTYTRCLKTHCT